MLAFAPASARAASDPPTGPALAAYVKARAADADGASDIAARGYAVALAADAGNEVIAIRAFREAMVIGDYALARRALSVLERSGVAPADASLLRFADQVKAQDWAGARATSTAIERGPLDFLGAVLRAWIALEEDGGDPLAVLVPDDANIIARRYIAENRALLSIATGQHREAADALKLLLGNDQASLDLRLSAAELFAAKGQRRLSRALLAGDDPVLAAQREALGRGEKPSAAFGASRMFTRLAVDLAGDEPSPLSILLTRVALLLDPGHDRARLLLAEALANEGNGPRALATLDAIPADSPFAGVVRAARVAVLSRRDDKAAAIDAARALVEAPDSGAATAQRFGDLLVDEGRFGEAAEAYALAMERAGERADWVLNLQRGGALEQAGRWPEAEPFLQRAVELAPDEPVALNYLAYARIERGEKLAESEALLERARSLRPDDPSITDSLGWAYVQRGQVAKGVPLLEQAARAEPADTTINEHLGDAYWQLGRRYEARYAWRAAAVGAEGKDAERLGRKVAHGLEHRTALR